MEEISEKKDEGAALQTNTYFCKLGLSQKKLLLMGTDIRDFNPGIKFEACWAASALSFSTGLVEKQCIFSFGFTSLAASVNILSFFLTVSLLLVFRVKYADRFANAELITLQWI